MKASLRQQFERLALRLHELDATLADGTVAADMKRFRDLTREHAEVSGLVERFRRFEQRERDLASAQQMLDAAQVEADIAEMAEEEVRAAGADIEALRFASSFRPPCFRAIPTTSATRFSRSAPAPAAKSRPSLPATSPACTCATASAGAGRPR